jgi:hypothetical protein
MRQLVEFPLREGGSVLVQVDDAAEGGPVTRGWRDQNVPEKARETFEQAISRVEPAAQALLTQLRGLAEPPDEVAVEFGVELSAQAGAFIAAAGSTANFKVSLTWRRPSRSPAPVPPAPDPFPR